MFLGTKLKLFVSRLYLDRSTFLKIVRKRLKKAEGRPRPTPSQNFRKSSFILGLLFYQCVEIGINPRNLAQGRTPFNKLCDFFAKDKISPFIRGPIFINSSDGRHMICQSSHRLALIYTLL